jgi:hypothetical protein
MGSWYWFVVVTSSNIISIIDDDAGIGSVWYKLTLDDLSSLTFCVSNKMLSHLAVNYQLQITWSCQISDRTLIGWLRSAVNLRFHVFATVTSMWLTANWNWSAPPAFFIPPIFKFNWKANKRRLLVQGGFNRHNSNSRLPFNATNNSSHSSHRVFLSFPSHHSS